MSTVGLNISTEHCNQSSYSGRQSVLFRDEHRTTNGGDAVIDMGSGGTYNSPMKQQLQVIDETVRTRNNIFHEFIKWNSLGYILSQSFRGNAEY